jgi:hypothetical protein
VLGGREAGRSGVKAALADVGGGTIDVSSLGALVGSWGRAKPMAPPPILRDGKVVIGA